MLTFLFIKIMRLMILLDCHFMMIMIVMLLLMMLLFVFIFSIFIHITQFIVINYHF